jgi:hypothetical protein
LNNHAQEQGAKVNKKQFLTMALAATTALASTKTATGQSVPGTQSAPGGLTLTYGISSGIRVNDNFALDTVSPGNTTILDTTLSFGLLKETQLDTLQFDLDGILRIGDVPGRSETVEFDDPNAFFAYTRDGANSRLVTNARINQVDLNFDDPLRELDQINSNSLIIDDGTRTTRRANVLFETGLSEPLGFGFDVQYFDERFKDTTDPGLFDNRTVRSEAFATFRFSSVTSGRLSYVNIDYDADDLLQEQRETDEVIFDLSYAINSITDLSAQIGYTDIDETDTTPISTNEDGLLVGLSLTRALANGSATVGVDSRVTITGRRTNVDISRSLALPNGSLSATLGASRGPSGDVDPIYQLAYTYTLANGLFDASVSRDFRTSFQGDDIRVTLVDLGYLVTINAISSLDFSFAYAAVDDAGNGSVTETDNATFRAAYTRALTADWNISTGYEYRHRFEQGVGSADSNEIFLTLDRFFVVQR